MGEILSAGANALSLSRVGPHATGKWTGLQNGFALLSGVVAPALTGFLVDRTETFLAPLAIAAALLLAGGIAWVFVVGPVEQVSWKSEPRTARAAAPASSCAALNAAPTVRHIPRAADG